MRILVTRPAEDGAQIARRLGELGHEAMLAPLLDVSFFEGAALDLDGVQALLATSANGVRALSKRTTRRDIPVFAVGPQTAQAARAAGFLRVRSAEGDAVALADAVCHWADSDAGALLHAAGGESGGWLAGALTEKGFTMRREDLYRVDAADTLPEDTVRALRDKHIQAVLFFSPRSARVFAACLEKAGLDPAGMIAVCISANTAAALERLSFAEVRIAAAPNQTALLACL
jgi:uroporphyrinogen-III synthase